MAEAAELRQQLATHLATTPATPTSPAATVPEDQLGLYVGGLRQLAAHVAGDRRVPPPAGWLVNHLLCLLGLSGHVTKVILLKGQALTRDLADRSLIFFRTSSLKDMAALAIKDYARSHDIRGLFAKDTLPAGALQTAFQHNAIGLTLRRVRLVTSFKVINRQSQPVLVLARAGRTAYEDATNADFESAATHQESSSTPAQHPHRDQPSRTTMTAKRTADTTVTAKKLKKGKH